MDPELENYKELHQKLLSDLVTKHKILSHDENYRELVLCIACVNGDIEFVKNLFEKFQDINICIRGQLPIRLACMHKKSEIIQFFLENFANIRPGIRMLINMVEKYPNFAHDEYYLELILCIACVNGDIRGVKMFYDRSQHQHQIRLNIYEYLPIRLACMNKKFGIAQFLLDKLVNTNDYDKIKCLIDLTRKFHLLSHDENYRELVLCIACVNGDIESVKDLFDKYDNINMYIGDELPIRLACMNKNFEIVKFLSDKFSDNAIHYNIESLIDFSTKYPILFHDENYREFLLCFKCQHHNIDSVKKLFGEFDNINVHIENDLPIRLASMNGKFEIVEFLLKKYSDFNIHFGSECQSVFDTNYHELVLCIACANGDLELVKSLIKNIRDINVHIHDELPIRLATRKGKFEIMEFLLNECPKINIHVKNESIFRWTCKNESLKYAQLLLNRYPNINVQAKYDYAICWASECSEELEKFLISRFVIANINDQNCYTHTLQSACQYGYYGIVRALLEKCPDIDFSNSDHYALYHASVNGYSEIVKLLLRKYDDDDYDSIIEYVIEPASGGGHLEILNFLLEKYTNDDIHKWIFRNACQYGYFDIIRMTIGKISDNDHEYYNNAFASACGNGRREIVELLLEKFRNIDIHFDNEMPFISACGGGQLEIVQFLLEKFPNIDVNANGRKAFVDACKFGHLKIVEFLFDKVNHQDMYAYGNEPIENASRSGRVEIVQFLLNRFPADYNLKYADRAFLAACHCGHLEIVKLLLDILPQDSLLEKRKHVFQSKSYSLPNIIDQGFKECCENFRQDSNEYYELARYLLNNYPINIDLVDMSLCRNEEILHMLKHGIPFSQNKRAKHN